MSAHEHDRLTAHFLGAVAREGEERVEFLARLGREEPELLSSVESLLRHDAAPPAIARTGGAAHAAGARLVSGACVGAYRVRHCVGEGAMGVVYLAEQREPLQRVVALKVMKPGFASLGPTSRFEAECRALERMSHPNIARVLDAGVSVDAGPYVVMEHVRGEPITRFADANRLEVEGRLRLFLLVCDALHHAHQNAILHRDVKPSNVLVAEIDGRAVPKVIDFGIATTLLSESCATAVRPKAHALIGTPGYMSPEHAGSAEAGSDIRSDVYSLGCLLYELLCGYPPFDPDALRLLTPQALEAFLRTTPPTPPSARPDPADRDWEVISSRRRMRPRGLIRRLRGDLDRIVAKAIARERSDRYASVPDLGADVRRFLDHHPVEAATTTAIYRFGKFVQRHRVGAAIAGAGAPLIVGFAIVMAFQAHRLAIERDRAEAFSEYLLEFYRTPLATPSRYGAHTPSDILFGGLDRVRGELRDDPVYAARMDQLVGEALRASGKPAEAQPILDNSRARLQALLGPEHAYTLTAGRDLAKALRDVGLQHDAELELTRVLQSQRTALGPSDPETLRTLRELGGLHKQLGAYQDAATLLVEARSRWLQRRDDDGPESALVTSLLGAVELELGRFDEAQAHLEEAIARLDDQNPEKALAVYNLGCALASRGDSTGALGALREAVDRGFVINFFADPHLASLHHDSHFESLAHDALLRDARGQDRLAARAASATAQGDYATAERLFKAVIAAVPSSHGYNGFRGRLGDLYMVMGRWAEAEPLVREARETLRRQRGVDELWIGVRTLDLARIRLGLGDSEGARRELDEASVIFERCRGLSVLSFRHYTRACVQALDGRRADALSSLDAAVEAGFQGADRLQADPALRSLHGDPEWKRLLESMRRRYELS
jgi:serine/threonine protein kinase/tetratricopeptide (TPR) repeat protein